MVNESGASQKIVVALLVIAVLFSALSVIVSLNVYHSFKPDFTPVRSTLPSDLAGSPSGQIGLTIIQAPGASP